MYTGYGDPGAAQWRSLPIEQRLRTVDFKDTFLNPQHLRECFPNYQASLGCCTGGTHTHIHMQIHTQFQVIQQSTYWGLEGN